LYSSVVRRRKWGFERNGKTVVLQNGKPSRARWAGKQQHPRKNHSYFLIYRSKGKMTPTAEDKQIERLLERYMQAAGIPEMDMDFAPDTSTPVPSPRTPT
jgi:hypothetical protein